VYSYFKTRVHCDSFHPSLSNLSNSELTILFKWETWVSLPSKWLLICSVYLFAQYDQGSKCIGCVPLPSPTSSVFGVLDRGNVVPPLPLEPGSWTTRQPLATLLDWQWGKGRPISSKPLEAAGAEGPFRPPRSVWPLAAASSDSPLVRGYKKPLPGLGGMEHVEPWTLLGLMEQFVYQSSQLKNISVDLRSEIY
jgi:hypothetical protein